MEGSESEAIFESLNLNPQLFVNEVRNTVDDVLDEAFDFFHQEASTKLNSEGSIQRSEDLKKGVDCVRQRTQSVLDISLAIWEKYCLLHCFAVPQGFCMPNSDKSNENGLHPDAPFDPDIDAQLNSLRTRLTEVGKEFEVLNHEIQILEKQSTVNAHYVNNAVQLYEQNHVLFQEIVTTAAELGIKIRKLSTTTIEESEQMKTKVVYSPELDLSSIKSGKDLSNMNLDDLQKFASIMKST
ncbi:protein MIS12 homolog isoform X2 [Arachis duranensis]|uniref:Protein MIS12 homolog isoform X2 n=1 Tax=Arachis duranensis TaxID=130453 RepID=A0A6P5N0P5_ARADU|nr:protein MIS12 homolog isoform X2 [Arachis hypogaea]XP_052113481.1 protein MIS12 homolog isoform X2 [Arachis duranensis]